MMPINLPYSGKSWNVHFFVKSEIFNVLQAFRERKACNTLKTPPFTKIDMLAYAHVTHIIRTHIISQIIQTGSHV